MSSALAFAVITGCECFRADTKNAAPLETTMVLAIAVPKEPPICWDVVRTADAAPVSSGRTLKSAVEAMDTKATPKPRLVTIIAGITIDTYELSTLMKER